MIRHDAATKVLPIVSPGLPKLRNVELQELIGRGQTADVYLGLHAGLRRAVAVKILHDHLSDRPEVVDRFRQEASVIADLHHPGIVQIHDLDEVDGRCYIVMEYLSGPTLAHHMEECARRKARIPIRDVIRIIIQVSDALGFAHQLGILHRDVKPGNIVLRSPTKEVLPGGALPADATPVLTDFGLARLNNRPRVTREGMTVGTPAYMSPEQVMGDHLDDRSDIYSLGVILYEMLTGDLPLLRDSDSLSGVLYKQVHQDFPRLPPHLRRLQSIVDRCLAKDREKRFVSTAELIGALRRYQEAYLGGNGVRAFFQQSMLNIEAFRARLIAGGTREPPPVHSNGKSQATFLNVRGLRDVMFGRPAPVSPSREDRPKATELNINLMRRQLLGASGQPKPATSPRRRIRWAFPALVLALTACGAMAWALGVPEAWLGLVGFGDRSSETRGAVPGEHSPRPVMEAAIGSPTSSLPSTSPTAIPPKATQTSPPASSPTAVPTQPPPTATSPPPPTPILPPLPTLPPPPVPTLSL